MNAVDDVGPLADPVAEARRLIAAAAEQRLLLRALGGVAVYLLAPDGKPRLPRRVKDIDVAVPRGRGRPAARLLEQAGYVGDQMFNALHGRRRLLFLDPGNDRHVDVFVGEFSMCHEIPLTGRLERAPLTVPPEELLLSKLQIVEATANDDSDLYSILTHYEVGGSAGIDGLFVASLCAQDWGLWRTCVGSLDRLRANLEKVPPTSEAYKRYLKKFDTQESEIEQLQEAIKQLQDQERKQQKEYESFLAELSVE